MKILIVSDSHGDIRNLAFVIKRSGMLDGIVHCGDGAGDLDRVRSSGIALPAFVEVRGNTDTNHHIPPSSLLEIPGCRLFVSHGHRVRTPDFIAQFVDLAREAQAQVSCFGHTHIPFSDRSRGILLVNPGSISRPRGSFGPSFAILEHADDDEKKIVAHFHEILDGPGGKSMHEIDI